MNVTAKELLQSIWLAGEHEDHEKKPLLLELPFEIREGIRYFTGLLTQEDNTYSQTISQTLFPDSGLLRA